MASVSPFTVVVVAVVTAAVVAVVAYALVRWRDGRNTGGPPATSAKQFFVRYQDPRRP